MGIFTKRVIPNDEFLALINANAPSSVNPFATMADVSSFIAPIHVANFSALPNPTTVPGSTYFVDASQGTKWLPGSLGGTYYPEGFYYSDGSATWIYTKNPYQANQAEVNAGVITDKFVSPATLNSWSALSNLDKFYTQNFVGALSFTILGTTHSFGRIPDVTLYDEIDKKMFASEDVNTTTFDVTITFKTPRTGTIILT